jgi:predicted Zn-dependent protease
MKIKNDRRPWTTTTRIHQPGEDVMITYGNKFLIILVLLLLSSSPMYALSYEKEREIAGDFITYLDSHNLIIYDREITWTLQMLMDRLADHIEGPVYPFKIHVVKDRSVNAFAIPDGHIFINVGTLLFVKDLNELAAVIAHEIGHAQMRHIAEQFEAQKKISTATIVGIIAGTLLSAANPEVGAALVYSSMGGSENIRLAYSRSNEYEADEFSWNLMKTSGMDPSGMTRFLIRMQTFTGGVHAPEYLLTHPYTENRIATVSVQPGEPNPDSRYWALYASVIGLMLSEEETTSRAQTLPEPYRSLALSIIKTRKGAYDEALALLDGIDLPLAYEYKGINLYHLGKKDEAYPYLKNYGKSAQAKIALAEIMEARGQIDPAISMLVAYQKQNTRVDYKLGILYEKSNKPALSHVSFARYFFKTHKYKASLYHIDKALESEKDLDKDLVEEMKEMKKFIHKQEQS